MVKWNIFLAFLRLRPRLAPLLHETRCGAVGFPVLVAHVVRVVFEHQDRLRGFDWRHGLEDWDFQASLVLCFCFCVSISAMARRR